MQVDNLQMELANILRELRRRQGLNKTQMADRLFLDYRTWSKYESGESAPTAPEFVRFFSTFNDDMLRAVLEAVYPSIYKGNDNVDDMRQAAAHFFTHVATDDMVRYFIYVAFGRHGSNIAPQLAEFVALDHLPLDYRVAIVKNIITFYRMAEMRGELVRPDDTPPDFDLLIDAIRKGLDAYAAGRNSYTTATKD